MTSRGAGTAFPRKNYRLTTEPEKSKVTGRGLYMPCENRSTVDPSSIPCLEISWLPVAATLVV